MSARGKVVRFCVSILWVSGLSASAWAQSASTTPEILDSTAVFPDAGGSYGPVSRGSFDLFREGVNTNDIANNPEVSIHFEAGAWGSGGNEPMVFAYVDAAFRAVPPADYLRAPTPLIGYARVECTRDVDVHCQCLDLAPAPCYHYTLAGASVHRPYRLVNTSGMMLPGDVKFIPVLVDYAVHRGTRATIALPEDQVILGTSTRVRLSYPDGQATFQRFVNCDTDCYFWEGDLAPREGTFEVPVSLRAAEDLLLDVSANIGINDRPNCVTVSTAQGDMCLVPPYAGVAWAHVDPYVYVDPSWEYADWFEVQTTADEAGTEWVEARRTAVDLSTFGIDGGGGSGGSDGTGGTAGSPDGGVPDAGTGGTGGSAGSPSGGTGDGGGCSISGFSPRSQLPFFVLLFALGIVAIRRTSLH
jgi:hypothetical protein